ncbi:MAG: alanine--tRNA ligase [Deltaproteobacteria bacterium]|nr:alanine--tRNA ligase [Deltaproteobacteria bacterium]MBI3390726.1 alanine--tRNA ligase [Deltaproteobacteria bacterium]
MTGAQIRSAFLEFFHRRGHEVVRSASLVPDKDPTLLFTNAGMVQFKDVFLGNETRANLRAASAQRCLRLSGKHNDLDEVGRDTYHHTLFEMLGNWSFGDYYKHEAIAWAWELLTKEWGLPKDRLYATVFTTDDEADKFWRSETDIGRDRILRFGEKDNFWEMGETGPCGPCSEIHIDRGAAACDRQHVAGHHCAVNTGCARYIELWNLVFIQYNRTADRSLEELRAKHVDTGMGLERVAAVMQDVQSNYDTDLFRAIITQIEEVVTSVGNRKPYGMSADSDVSYRAIADHARAISSLVAEGLRPGNGEREYVLRRLIRRAARHARRLDVGMIDRLLVSACRGVIEVMGVAYKDLVEQQEVIYDVVREEESRFHVTLLTGESYLRGAIEDLGSGSILPGEVAFRLYDTHGFPLDMTEDILREDGITIDQLGFDKCMEGQRQRSREARRETHNLFAGYHAAPSRFVGDHKCEIESEIVAIYRDETECPEVREGDIVDVITAETPFYGESGGQVGDRGQIETADGALIEVSDTQKPRADLTVHIGTVRRGAFRRGQRVRLAIDREWRDAARLNHSATHILNAVLRERLGTHVRQAGSLVAPERLRFDFTHPNAIDDATLIAIEEQTNAHIRENAVVVSEEMAYDDAIKRGALAFFGDKYGDRVRVVKMGEFSTELCGGTHVQRTGDIGVFKVRSEAGVAAGVRRLEAMTGAGALASIRQREMTLRQLGELVKGNETEVAEKVERLLAQQRELEKQLQQLRSQVAGSQSADLLSQAFISKAGFKVVAAHVDGVDGKRLLEMADALRDRMGSGVVILASGSDDKVSLLAAVTKDLTAQVNAGKLIGQIAPIVGGRGGGRPELAQAGGKDPAKISDALKAARALFE